MPLALRLTALLLIAGALAAAATGASTSTDAPVVTASSFGVSVLVPGQQPVASGASSAPGATTSATADSFAFPADGSLVRVGALSTSSASRADSPTAQAVSDAVGISLFGGEVTADGVGGRAKAVDGAADVAGSRIANLVVLGTPVAAAPNKRVQLGDWGFLVTLEQVVESSTADGRRTDRGAVNAIHVFLSAPHAGQPAGTEILIGHAEAAATAKVPTAAPLPLPAVKPTTTAKPDRPEAPRAKARKPLPKPPEQGSTPRRPGAPLRIPPTDVSAPLSPEGYVFPVYGPSSFTDTFGAARAGVGWHHGEDIFGTLGSPLLAVADGTVFSVGWNNIGGYRFWLRDRQGNQFYYAHLSAFSPLAVDGREVKAGDVIGFMGNTGDAQGTPYHVHFEIHPVGLLPLGYDGVVNAFPYLSAWRRLEDVSFAAGRGWAPPVPPNATAPRPAAVLLGSRDISSASGLEPGSLEKALAAPVSAQG
jgi:murein DD-endopeptidase MepM/ murein hydrolase activator NlpD